MAENKDCPGGEMTCGGCQVFRTQAVLICENPNCGRRIHPDEDYRVNREGQIECLDCHLKSSCKDD